MRRLFSRLAAAAALLPVLVLPAFAQDWPAGKTVQIVVPAPGGGGTGDSIARVVSEALAKRLQTSVVIDNKPGANGNIGASAAATAAPDGHHLLFSWAGTLAVNPSLYRNLSYDPQKDFVPIVLIADVPNILVVNNDLPAKDLAEFTRYAKANPGKLNFGSTGNGSSMHLAGELFMRETGAQMVHVPYNAPGTATTKAGSMRQTTIKPEAGRIYFMLFSNPNRMVKEGSSVSLIIGDFIRKHMDVFNRQGHILGKHTIACMDP